MQEGNRSILKTKKALPVQKLSKIGETPSQKWEQRLALATPLTKSTNVVVGLTALTSFQCFLIST